VKRISSGKKGWICLFILVIVGPTFADISPPLLFDNPFNGSLIFASKGCQKCHSVWGTGQTFGPDLTAMGQTMDFYELAGALWSHSPKMRKMMEERDIRWPVLSSEELERLVAFIYFLAFFEVEGDYHNGERIFRQKGCIQCHSLEKNKKISLTKYGYYVSPAYMAAELWNHSSNLSPLMSRLSFLSGEMSDLLVYLRTQSWNPEGKTVYLRLPNPKRGQEIFREKRCADCHGEEAQGLKRSPLRKGLTGIVRTMWNHSYEMWARIKQKGLDIPHFTAEEMADLMAFLYFVPFYDERWDIIKGGQIFVSKGCSSCHGTGEGGKMRGPDLASLPPLTSSELISAMWNHVGEMEKMTTELNLPWPRFGKDEMKNLIGYLQSLIKKKKDKGN